jgi:hypothetical protein
MGWLRRNSWSGLMALSVILVGFGISDIFIGSAGDPGIPQGLIGLSPMELRAESEAGYRILDFFTRTQGLALLALGLVGSATLLFAYRRDQRWAWWTMWALPAWSGGVFTLYLVTGVDPTQPLPPPMLTGPFFFVLTVAVQLVSAPRFFQKTEPA